MVGYFMGCCQWYDSYLYDSYESVDRIFLKDYLVSARELSSLAGKIISAGAVFGNISRIMTRYCSISVVSSHLDFIWINVVSGNLIFGKRI